MTILNLSQMNLSDVFEPTVIPAGTEVKLRIINIIEGTNAKGNAYIMPFFECQEEPYMKEFGQYMELPNSEMDAKRLNRSKLELTNFFNAFDIDASGDINLEEVKGREGWAILGIGKDKEDQPVNKINKFIFNF